MSGRHFPLLSCFVRGSPQALSRGQIVPGCNHAPKWPNAFLPKRATAVRPISTTELACLGPLKWLTGHTTELLRRGYPVFWLSLALWWLPPSPSLARCFRFRRLMNQCRALLRVPRPRHHPSPWTVEMPKSDDTTLADRHGGLTLNPASP